MVFLALAQGPMLLGHTGVNYASGRCGTTWHLAVLGEPVGATLIAWLLPAIAERPSSSTLVGGGLILLGIAVALKRGPARDPMQEGEREEGQPGPDPDDPAFGWRDESGGGSGEGRG